jgi:26S proteasome regulatory subunit N4
VNFLPTSQLSRCLSLSRNDIDLIRVRQIRQRVICLQNDHKALMKQIEEGLIQVHQTTANDPSSPSNATTTMASNPILSNKEPFLRVDIVSGQSPAETAGLQVGDLVCRIGTIRKDNYRTMQDVASLVNNSENRSITLLVQRANTKDQQTLTLTPKKWSGNGLLGCKLTPLS